MENGVVTKRTVASDEQVTTVDIPIFTERSVAQDEPEEGGAAAAAAAAHNNEDEDEAAQNSFTLTDDGVPVPVETLKCPLCPAEFMVSRCDQGNDVIIFK